MGSTRHNASYADELVATAEAQSRFFREQAERHHSEASQARTFADLSATASERAELERRAMYLETMSDHDRTMARQISGSVRRDA